MRIPKELTINHNQWRVEYKWNLTYRGQHVLGLCDPNTKTIFIERSLPREEKFWTFRHEFKHAVFEEYGCGHNSELITTDQEEAMIEALEYEDRANWNFRWKHKK